MFINIYNIIVNNNNIWFDLDIQLQYYECQNMTRQEFMKSNVRWKFWETPAWPGQTSQALVIIITLQSQFLWKDKIKNKIYRGKYNFSIKIYSPRPEWKMFLYWCFSSLPDVKGVMIISKLPEASFERETVILWE